MSLRATSILLIASLALSACQSDSTREVTPTEESVTAVPRAEAQPSEPEEGLSPSETVLTMMHAYLDKRLGEYYSYVASIDRQAKSLDSLQAEFAPTAADFVIDFLFSETEFDVDSARVFGDSAVVYTTSNAPPVPFVMQQAQIIERDLGRETDAKTKMDVLGERYRLSGAPREENHAAYLLLREANGWKVVVGWADMKEALEGADPPGGT